MISFQHLLVPYLVSGELRKLDLTALKVHELKSFWINIRHAMLLHGYIANGFPTSPVHRKAFFNSTSYLIGIDGKDEVGCICRFKIMYSGFLLIVIF